MPRLPSRNAPARLAPAALLTFALGLPGPAPAGFTESAETFGIASGDSMSYAAGFVDFDGDSDPDFYANNHWKSHANFYRNEGGSSFAEMSDHFLASGRDRHDQIWADLDNDGDPDQYIVHGAGQNSELFWNLGKGVLLEGAVPAGVENVDGRGREIAITDLNGDHLLDLFVVNDYREGFLRPSELFWNNGDGTFTADPRDELLFRSRQHVAAADYDLDGNVDLVVTDPPFVPGELWRGNGDSTWTDVTALAFPGILDPFLEAQGLTWADYDNDGDLDLFTCSGNRGVWDFAGLESDSLRFYVETDSAEYESISFTTDGDSVTIDVRAATYGPVTCWYGGAGDSVSAFPVKLATAVLIGEPPALAGGAAQGVFLWSVPAVTDTVHFRSGGPGPQLNVGGSLRANESGILSWSAVIDAPPPYSSHDWSNRLYRNDGTTFAEVTSAAFAVNDSTANSKGAAWGDYDNDGWIDVYVSNGGTVTTGNQPNWLYRNNGDGTFTDVAAFEGVTGPSRGMSDGGAWADVDGDGFLDLFVDNGAEHPPFGVGPRQLFVNAPNGNHWLSLRLRGLTSNGSGIGARVRFVTASGTQWRTRLGESDNCFSNDHALHVGLGSDSVVDSLQVFWPSGHVDTYEQVAADRKVVAIEGKPLRTAQNPHFIVRSGSIVDVIERGMIESYNVTVDNFGGLASDYVASYETCAGVPVGWMSVTPESSWVFPGGTDPLLLTVDTNTMIPGLHCARVVFHTNSYLGPDTLYVTITVTDAATGVDALAGLPDRFGLGRPRPNPSRGNVEVVLDLPVPAGVNVAVFDVGGRRVATLRDEPLPAGRHPASWDARDGRGLRVGAGIYFVRAVAGPDRATRKIVILE